MQLKPGHMYQIRVILKYISADYVYMIQVSEGTRAMLFIHSAIMHMGTNPDFAGSWFTPTHTDNCSYAVSY